MARITREIFDEFIEGWDTHLSNHPPGEMSKQWLEDNLDAEVVGELKALANSTLFLALLDSGSFALTFFCWGMELGKASARVDAIRNS